MGPKSVLDTVEERTSFTGAANPTIIPTSFRSWTSDMLAEMFSVPNIKKHVSENNHIFVFGNNVVY
jgi:hypothetical protein